MNNELLVDAHDFIAVERVEAGEGAFLHLHKAFRLMKAIQIRNRTVDSKRHWASYRSGRALLQLIDIDGRASRR